MTLCLPCKFKIQHQFSWDVSNLVRSILKLKDSTEFQVRWCVINTIFLRWVTHLKRQSLLIKVLISGFQRRTGQLWQTVSNNSCISFHLQTITPPIFWNQARVCGQNTTSYKFQVPVITSGLYLPTMSQLYTWKFLPLFISLLKISIFTPLFFCWDYLSKDVSAKEGSKGLQAKLWSVLWSRGLG